MQCSGVSEIKQQSSEDGTLAASFSNSEEFGKVSDAEPRASVNSGDDKICLRIGSVSSYEALVVPYLVSKGDCVF